jgi:hypothetical protein
VCTLDTLTAEEREQYEREYAAYLDGVEPGPVYDATPVERLWSLRCDRLADEYRRAEQQRAA